MDDPALCLRDTQQQTLNVWLEIFSLCKSVILCLQPHWSPEHILKNAVVEFTSVRPLMPFLLGLKWFLTYFSSLTVLWLLFCADEEVSRKHIGHVIYYTYVQSTAGKWLGLYQTGLVLNGSVRTSLCLLSLIPICLEKEENSPVKPWPLFRTSLSYAPSSSPSHSSPNEPLENSAHHSHLVELADVFNRSFEFGLWFRGLFIGVSYQLAKYLFSRKTGSDLPCLSNWTAVKLSILLLLCIMHFLRNDIWLLPWQGVWQYLTTFSIISPLQVLSQMRLRIGAALLFSQRLLQMNLPPASWKDPPAPSLLIRPWKSNQQIPLVQQGDVSLPSLGFCRLKSCSVVFISCDIHIGIHGSGFAPYLWPSVLFVRTLVW